MSKITIKQIESALKEHNWTLVSTEYVNLDTGMQFRCPEKHDVYTSWKKLRNNIECPICKRAKLPVLNTEALPKPKGSTRTIALDQASHITGYAVFDDIKLVASGTFETNIDDEIARIAAIRNWLASMILSWRPDIIGLEGIQFQEQGDGRKMGVTVFETLAHLQGALMLLCYDNNIQYKICPTNTWRHICGVKGRTRTDKKRSMQLLVKQWYNVNVSDDIADAIGIGHYLCNIVNKYNSIESWEV